MGNQALDVNSVFEQADLGITIRGSDWIFTVCSIMGACCLAVIGHSFTRPAHQRLFHQLIMVALFVGCVSNFAVASNLGQVPIQVEFVRGGKVVAAGTREIFYARYIDWFITTPLLLSALLLTASVSWSTLLAVILVDEAMVVCYLLGALTQTTYKWGFWTFGVAAFLYIAYSVLIVGRRGANNIGGTVRTTYNISGIVLITTLLLYPIAFGCSEGGNVIHPDSEAIFYGILDLLAKVVFPFLLLWGHRNISFESLGLNTTEAGRPVIREKGDYHASGIDGVGNGVDTQPTTANGANGATAAV
ncbi:unnamed protein product [Clonostachys solani]|uniref:Opsin-like protein carO n=1 Tax=Clonostachys solani TaxID=160281 RepID=A0A9N9ZCD8_9HYPO|nr:unnamed protein product [Clonostachys solani]